MYNIERTIHRTYDPILNSVERQKRTIKNDGSPDDLFRIAKLQGMLNNTVLKIENNEKLKEDGVFGDKTKNVYDVVENGDADSERIRQALKHNNINLVNYGLSLQKETESKGYSDNIQDKLKVADYQRKLNDAGFTDENDKPLKEDGVFGDKTKGVVNSYIWEDGNQGIILLSSKSGRGRGKGNNNTRKDKRHGSENRQPSGDRERNIGHPEGEEHSRVPKGAGSRGSNGFNRIEAEDVGKAVVGGAAAVGAGYLIYRGIRMLPSLLPPLWWTIPVNLATP